jgi:phage baseplate assembly protein W
MVPLQMGPSGTIATVTDQDSITSQHVQALISTVQAERIMLPGYGLPLAGLVFAGNDPVLENVIQNDVIDAFQQWEPDLTLLTVNQSNSTDIQSGIAAVSVTYQSNQSNTVSTSTTPITQQATISSGGTIVDK